VPGHSRVSRSNTPISADQLSCFIAGQMKKKEKKKRRERERRAARIKALFHEPLARAWISVLTAGSPATCRASAINDSPSLRRTSAIFNRASDIASFLSASSWSSSFFLSLSLSCALPCPSLARGKVRV